VLLFVGQPMDYGSESKLAELRDEAERENVAVYALVLPEAGKAFVSDTFSLEGLSSKSDRGGFKAGVDLGRLVPTLNRAAQAEQGRARVSHDPRGCGRAGREGAFAAGILDEVSGDCTGREACATRL
jgi:hypothetical protein